MLSRIIQLGACPFARHQVMSTLGYRPRYLAAPQLDFGLSIATIEVGQRARHHKDLPTKFCLIASGDVAVSFCSNTTPASFIFCMIRWLYGFLTIPQRYWQSLGLSHPPASSTNTVARQLVDILVVVGQHVGYFASYVHNTQAKQQPVERTGFAILDVGEYLVALELPMLSMANSCFLSM